MSNAEDNNDMSGIELLTNTPTNASNILMHCHSPAVSNNVGMVTNESCKILTTILQL